VSRQIKQVRLMDRSDIPIEMVYRAEVSFDDGGGQTVAVTKVLSTKNTAVNHLGLALPSGHISTFAVRDDTPLLLDEQDFSDTTLNQDIELPLGESDDVGLTTTLESLEEASESVRAEARKLLRIPGVAHADSPRRSGLVRLEISNARPQPVTVEVSLQLPDALQIVRADPLPSRKNGLPTFKVTVPANGRFTIRFQAVGPADT
jgi:hypothetical protein